MSDDRELEPGQEAPPEVVSAEGRDLEEPRGLLGLLLWPIRAAVALGLRLFAAFVAGVLGALIPGLRKERDPDGTADGGDAGPDHR